MTTKFVLRQNLIKTQTPEIPAESEYFFDGNIFTIGSDAANNLVLPGAAPEQLVVMREDERLTLMNSADGTVLNGAALRREAIEPVKNGDEIQIGNYTISVVVAAEDYAQRSENAASRQLSSAAAAGNAAENAAPPLAFPPPAAGSATNESAAESKAPRNFAAVLDTLRTEEDSFYFIRQNPNGESVNVPLEDVATPIGETAAGDIAFTIAEISTVFAIARKDWSGILLESQRAGAVFVNDEPVETTRRLRNDDRVSFASRSKISLLLHEPSSLVALESLLSARVDSSDAARFGGLAAKTTAPEEIQVAPVAPKKSVSASERRYLNYFSLLEIVVMLIGTLIGAVLIFLFLEIVLS